MADTYLERIIEIDRLIRRGRFTTTREMSQKFRVTQRTIERDLITLKNDLHAEIEIDKQRGLHVYKNNPIALPARWLSQKDLGVLLLAERALRGIKNTSYHSRIHSIFNKFLAPLRRDEETMEYIREFCGAIQFNFPDQKSDTSGEFSKIHRAIMNKRCLSLSISGNGEKPDRTDEIEPYVLSSDGGNWQVIGFSRFSRREMRYELSRLSNIKTTRHFGAVPKEYRGEILN